MNKERLLNVAKALREAPQPEAFDMGMFVHSCGTPACALGHYGCRPDLQDVFTVKKGSMRIVADDEGGFHIFTAAREHFGINRFECDELFESDGCGGATTAIEAAEYIERFVESRS